MYTGAYEMEPAISWRILRVRMWLEGHTFEEIDQLNLDDVGDILGFWSEKDRVDSRQRDQSSKLGL